MIYGPSELLFKKGDQARHFFIVVKGCVNIYLSKDRYLGESRIDSENMPYEDLKRAVKNYCNKVKEKYGDVDLIRYALDPFFFDQKTYDFKHHLATSYSDGTSFGELALMRGAPRAGSAISKIETFLAALDVENFRKILHFEHNLKIERKMRFFKDSLLGDMEYNDQVKIAYYFSTKIYKKNDVIFSQGDQVKSVYIVKKGTLELRAFSKIDVLGLNKIEKDPQLRMLLERNAREVYGLINSTSVVQKVSEVGEKILLADWTEPVKEYLPPHQLYTAIAVTEELALYECSFVNYMWIKDNYPDLAASILKRSRIKNQKRAEQLSQANKIRTATEKEAKGINENNLGIKLFTVESQSQKYTLVGDQEREALKEASLKDDVDKYDYFTKSKKANLERLGDSVGEDVDDMIRGAYKQYRMKGKSRRAPTASAVADEAAGGRYKHNLGYKIFLRKFLEAAVTEEKKYYINASSVSQTRRLNSKDGNSALITTVANSKSINNSKISVQNSERIDLDKGSVPIGKKRNNFSVDSIESVQKETKIPKVSIYNFSKHSLLPVKDHYNSTGNLTLKDEPSTKQATGSNFAKTIESRKTKRSFKAALSRTDENFHSVNASSKSKKDSTFEKEASSPEDKASLITKPQVALKRDAELLANKKRLNFRLEFARKRYVASQNNLINNRSADTTQELSHRPKVENKTFYVTKQERKKQSQHSINLNSEINIISAREMFEKLEL